eukprot:scaffold4712_cov80-Skeletonema_menzelii.AAC.3
MIIYVISNAIAFLAMLLSQTAKLLCGYGIALPNHRLLSFPSWYGVMPQRKEMQLAVAASTLSRRLVRHPLFP